MLVLTRKTQQQIQIGNNIVITILQVKGQAVRVGIEAPRDVRVIRSEVNEKDAAEAALAAAATAEPSRGRRAGLRVPGTESAAVKPFSSPEATPSAHAGESHGLFPHLRRRSQQHDERDSGPESRLLFGAAQSRGLAMRIS